MENSFDLKKFLTEGKLLKENKEELIRQLIALASSGELDNDDIKDLNQQLLSARRKMFANKITPDQRKASTAKAMATKIKEKEEKAAKAQVYKMLGLERNYPAQFALDLNMHRDEELQKRFNDEVAKILNNK
jgi:hypothetical protein